MSGVASSVMMPVAPSVRYAHSRPMKETVPGCVVAACSRAIIRWCGQALRLGNMSGSTGRIEIFTERANESCRDRSRLASSDGLVVEPGYRHHVGGRPNQKQLVEASKILRGQGVLAHLKAE